MQTAVVIPIERLQETPSYIYSYINTEVCVNSTILQPFLGVQVQRITDCQTLCVPGQHEKGTARLEVPLLR